MTDTANHHIGSVKQREERDSAPVVPALEFLALGASSWPGQRSRSGFAVTRA